MSKNFSKAVRIAPTAHNCNMNGLVTLATINADKYVNLITSDRQLTISPEEAKEIRDVLLAAFPLEVATPSKFKVGDKVTYRAIVGYAARGMDGRKGTVKLVKGNEWYHVDFGHTLGQLVPVHSDYLTATPEETTVKFKAGDLVRRTGGSWGGVATGGQYRVERVNLSGSIRLIGYSRTFSSESFEIVSELPGNAGPVSGRYIVAALEGSTYAPNSKPYVHLSDKAAEAEAERLAKEHGGTFHVFRATFEATREKPVIPPVKTAKL